MGKVYAAWAMKVFIRRGQKTPAPKNEGIENGSNSSGKAENQVWHVSCIRCFHGESFQSTSNLLRGISRSTHGDSTAGCFDLQLTCQ
jgi:hypothetical protein